MGSKLGVKKQNIVIELDALTITHFIDFVFNAWHYPACGFRMVMN